MRSINVQKLPHPILYYLVTWIIFYLLYKVNIATAIACYSCVSVNKSNPACEDPVSAHVQIQRPCRQTIPGHDGFFYAHYCSKIKGIRQKDGFSLLIRRCSMDKLSDIPTHCGQFQLDEDLYHGCIATCSKDWCNVNNKSSVSDWTLILSVLTLLCNVVI
ncbi:unnamed protein product [Heterobilharzia americana]|nr:unnamed protein product [Heterobilharzia americana]CAH8581069.1 unnamed protein product [Heterobilharzia americana]